MLSINEIKSYSFQPQKGGSFYRSSDVDEFQVSVNETLMALTSAYERAKHDNEELYKKIAALSNKIDEYKNNEDSIRSALLIAQRTGESMIKEAKDKSVGIVKTAETQAQKTIDTIKSETENYVLVEKEKADQYYAQMKEKADSIFLEAQKKAEAVLNDSASKAERIISETQKQAVILLREANTRKVLIEKQATEKIQTVDNKLNNMKALTLQFKTGVIDIMKKQISLLETIPVDERDYRFTEDDIVTSEEKEVVYRPEMTKVEQTQPVIEQPKPIEENKNEINFEEKVLEITNQVEKEAEKPVAIENEPKKEVKFEDISSGANKIEEKTSSEEKPEENEIDKKENSEIDTQSQTKNEETQVQEETDYYASLMARLSVEEEKKKQESKENTKNKKVFTDIDSGKLPDDEKSSAEQTLKFGKDYDIFSDENDGETGFFSKFKKK